MGARNFALFFPSPATVFYSFLPLLGVLSWNFGGVLKRRGPEMCTFGVLGLSCEAGAALRPPGLHTTARELQRRGVQRREVQRRAVQRRGQGLGFGGAGQRFLGTKTEIEQKLNAESDEKEEEEKEKKKEREKEREENKKK